MAKSVWDLCYLDSDALTAIEQIQPVGHLGQPDSSAAANRSKATAVGDDEDKDSKASSVENSNNIYNLQESIVSAEQACRESLALVDGLLNVLNEVEVDYEDVTGRTNSLMMNCENLLEQQVCYIDVIDTRHLIVYFLQKYLILICFPFFRCTFQHTYQQTVEILKHTLEPFNDIESVASLLGIPFDPNSHSVANNNSNSQDHISSLSQAYASSSSPAGALLFRFHVLKLILCILFSKHYFILLIHVHRRLTRPTLS